MKELEDSFANKKGPLSSPLSHLAQFIFPVFIGGMLRYGIPEFRLPKNKLVQTTHDLDTNERGLLITDENCMTTHPGVFSAGDVVQGPHTVVHAVEEAKRAAAAMMRYMEPLH